MRLRLLALSCVVLLWGSIATAAAPEPVRAIFDEGVFWADGNPAKVRAVLERVARAGFNTYIPCVWHGQGATWQTDVVAPWYRNPELASRDPLGHFVRMAREYSIDVLPCFTLVLRQHSFYPELTAQTGGGRVFDVHDPAFRRLARDIVLDVALRYDVAGVNLDYVRAGQVCYDEDCRADYAARTGRSLMLDLAARAVSAEADAAVVGWQRAAVRQLIEDIVVPLRARRPESLVTVDAAPWAESVVIEGQDSLAWADSGLVDLVFSMNYQDELPWQDLRALRAGMKEPQRLALMVANYRRLDPDADPLVGSKRLVSKEGPELVELIDAARRFNDAGHFAVYIYSMLTDAQVDALSRVGSDGSR